MSPERKLKILVVEDDVNHLAEARSYFNKHDTLETDYATTLKQARDLIEQNKKTKKPYDGVITDCFYASGYGNEEDRALRQTLDDLINPTKWSLATNHLAPMGIILVEELDENYPGMKPAVFCTETYHHSIEGEDISQYARERTIPYVDNNPYVDSDLGFKYWEYAKKKLLLRIAGCKYISFGIKSLQLSDDPQKLAIFDFVKPHLLDGEIEPPSMNFKIPSAE